MRRYKATEIRCFECGAAAGDRCRRPDSRLMSGVHRQRDRDWNRLDWLRRNAQRLVGIDQ